jgi:hypothetical protein
MIDSMTTTERAAAERLFSAEHDALIEEICDHLARVLRGIDDRIALPPPLPETGIGASAVESAPRAPGLPWASQAMTVAALRSGGNTG